MLFTELIYSVLLRIYFQCRKLFRSTSGRLTRQERFRSALPLLRAQASLKNFQPFNLSTFQLFNFHNEQLQLPPGHGYARRSLE